MNNKARTPNYKRDAAIKALMVFAAIGMILTVFRVCQKIVSPSPDRSAGAYRVSPRLVHVTAGLPRTAVALAPAGSVLPPEHPDRKLLSAIRMKEGWKGGREPSPDGEEGPYQITYRWYLDACMAAGVEPDSLGWRWPDVAYDEHKIPFLMHWYWLWYLGPDADDYSKALAHRGGPPSGQDMRAQLYAAHVMAIKRAMGGE